MSLEHSLYTKCKYRDKIYKIYSEIDYNNWTISLIDNDGYIFVVEVSEIILIKEGN